MARNSKIIALLTFAISIGLYCCIDRNNQSDKKSVSFLKDSADSDTVKKHQPGLSLRVQNEIPKELDFPFGPEILTTHKFPRKWKMAINNNDMNPIPRNHEKQLNEAIKFTAEKLITCTYGSAKKYDLPDAKTTRLFKLDYPYEFNDSLINSVDYFNFKLPKIHGFESFFACKVIGPISSEFALSSVGILFIYNKNKEELVKIPVYMGVSTDLSDFTRLFYITSNEIKVFNFLQYYEDGEGLLNNEFIVNIQSNGEIKVRSVLN